MKSLIVASLFLPAICLANPGVTKNTDVKVRKAKKHYQVTRCVEDVCQVYEVTEFNKPYEEQGDYSRECFFIVEGTKRFMACSKEPTKPKVVVLYKPVVTEKVVEKVVEKTVTQYIEPKKNRFSLHVGYGPTGLKTESNEDNTVVKEKKGVVFGAGYDRLVSSRFSVGGHVYTNKMINLSLGFNF